LDLNVFCTGIGEMIARSSPGDRALPDAVTNDTGARQKL
jgi:hypothetical protein